MQPGNRRSHKTQLHSPAFLFCTFSYFVFPFGCFCDFFLFFLLSSPSRRLCVFLGGSRGNNYCSIFHHHLKSWIMSGGDITALFLFLKCLLSCCSQKIHIQKHNLEIIFNGEKLHLYILTDFESVPLIINVQLAALFLIFSLENKVWKFWVLLLTYITEIAEKWFSVFSHNFSYFAYVVINCKSFPYFANLLIIWLISLRDFTSIAAWTIALTFNLVSTCYWKGFFFFLIYEFSSCAMLVDLFPILSWNIMLWTVLLQIEVVGESSAEVISQILKYNNLTHLIFSSQLSLILPTSQLYCSWSRKASFHNNTHSYFVI